MGWKRHPNTETLWQLWQKVKYTPKQEDTRNKKIFSSLDKNVLFGGATKEEMILAKGS